MPAAARNDFPECLVLGPEQLKVIQESKHYNKIVLHGGAGCGKTFMLLYMLYKNTSKHLIESDCKNVVFVIPEAKTELKAFVEKFVEDFCNCNYVFIQSFECFRHFSAPQGSKLILFDEIYCSYFHYNFTEFAHVSAKIIVALGIFDGVPYGTYFHMIPSEWTMFHLLASCRNPSNISSLCKKFNKLVQQANKKWAFSKPVDFIFMALDSSLKVNNEESIEIKNLDYCSEVGKEIAERKEKTLLVADDQNAFKSEFLNEYTNRVYVNLKEYEVLVRNLAFTGVQYKTVVILLLKSTKVNSAILTVLYHSISRSTHRVMLLSPDPESYKTLLAATSTDLKVFEKLRRQQNVPKEDLMLLTIEEERWEAVQLTVLTKNWSMLDSLIETFTSRRRDSAIQKYIIRLLLGAFPLCENGEILRIIWKNFSDAIDIQQMLIGYIDSAFIISTLPNVPARNRLREQFMNLIPGRNLYTDFVDLIQSKKTYVEPFQLIHASLIWGDRRMFMQLVQMTRNDLHLLSRRLSELSSNLPENMKELFEWVELSPEEMISLQQAEQVFTEGSALTENGKLKSTTRQLTRKNWRKLNKFREVNRNNHCDGIDLIL